MNNLYIVGVHESPECIRDLLENLHTCDPQSNILLHNGCDERITIDFDVTEFNVTFYPERRKLEWGRTCRETLDVFRYACKHLEFDIVTMLDSDMLATRKGYSNVIEAGMEGDMPRNLGALTRCPSPAELINNPTGPIQGAMGEHELWKHFLKGRPLYYSFGPGTVFTWPALAQMVNAFDTEPALQAILQRSKVLALEEVLFITVIASLGYQVCFNPTSQDYIKWRHEFTAQDVRDALARPDVFFIHPIAREYYDPLRAQIREEICTKS